MESTAGVATIDGPEVGAGSARQRGGAAPAGGAGEVSPLDGAARPGPARQGGVVKT